MYVVIKRTKDLITWDIKRLTTKRERRRKTLRKSPFLSESDESEEELSEYIGDVWDSVMETSYENLKEEFDSLVDEYVTAGTDRDQAEILAKKKLLPKYRDEAVQEYYRGILWQTHMSRDPIHKKIKATAKRLREDEDYEPLEAWKYAIEKRKFLLDQKIKKFKPIEDSE